MIPVKRLTASPKKQKLQLQAIQSVLTSGNFILGKHVDDFERSWAQFCGASYSVGVANGMDALEIGMRCLDIGPGDEVITTDITAFATVLSILKLGATPVLADIDPSSGLISEESVKSLINPRTKAIIVVHLYGYFKNIQKWKDIADSAGVHLIEDCAQAHGCVDSTGNRVGLTGIFSAFSFYPTKNLGGYGDSGALVTNQHEIYERSKILRNYGQSSQYEHKFIGLNSRMDELQAALLLIELQNLEKETKSRRTIADNYRQNINNPNVFFLEEPHHKYSHVYHQFVVKVKDRSGFQNHLENCGVMSQIHYPCAISAQPIMRQYIKDFCDRYQSHTFAGECVSIPCFPGMTPLEIDAVTAAVQSYS